MDRQSRSNLLIGVILLLLGGWFRPVLVPGLGDLINIEAAWPLIVVAVGGSFF